MCVCRVTSLILGLILILIRFEESMTETECEFHGNLNSIPVVSMCFNDNVVSNVLYLDTYDAKRATNTNPCVCTATVSTPVNITFFGEKAPEYQSCGNIVVITSASYSASLNCFVVAPPMQLRPGTGALFSLTKPSFPWDERFCIKLTADDNNALINMTCYDNTTASSVEIPYTTTTPGPTTTTTEATTNATTTVDQLDTTTSASTTAATTNATNATTTVMELETTTTSSMATTTDTTTVVTNVTQSTSENDDIGTTKKLPDPEDQTPNETTEIPWNIIIPLLAAAAFMLIVCVASCFIHYDRKKSIPYEVAKKEGENLVLQKYDNKGFEKENEISEMTLTPEQIPHENKDDKISNGHIHNTDVNGSAGAETIGNISPDSPTLYAELNPQSSPQSDFSEKSSRF